VVCIGAPSYGDRGFESASLQQRVRCELHPEPRILEPRYRQRHAGGGNGLPRRRTRLVEMIDLADMLGGMSEFEPDALAVPAGRKAPALDHRQSSIMPSWCQGPCQPDCGDSAVTGWVLL